MHTSSHKTDPPLKLADAVNRSTLERIQSAYTNLLGTTAVTFDTDGSVLSKSRVIGSFCDLISATDSGESLCYQDTWAVGKRALDSGKPARLTCHAGVDLFATPVRIGGANIAVTTLAIGLPPTDAGKISQIASRVGLDPDRLLSAAQAAAETRYDQVYSVEHLITGLADLYGELYEKTQQFFTLFDIANLANSVFDLDSSLREIEDKIVALTKSENAAIILFDEQADGATTIARFVTPAEEDKLSHTWRSLSLTEIGTLHDLVSTDEPVVILENDLTSRFGRLAPVFGNRNVLLAPLVHADKITGTLCLSRNQSSPFSRSDLTLASIASNQAAFAVESFRIHEIERKRLKALEELDKLRSDFLSNVSHELRTPLTTIKGSLDVALRRWDELDERKRLAYAVSARDAANNLMQLVEDMLLVSRIATGKLHVRATFVDVAPLLTEAIMTVQHQHCGRQVEVDLPTELPLVKADPSRTVQVLVNILDNAAKFSQPNSPIRLKGLVDGSELVISIGDEGAGIAQEDLTRIFTKFGRVDRTVRVRNGTGLGLYICKNLVEMMGGRIWAESQVGRGSTFSFTLPVATGWRRDYLLPSPA